MVITTASTGAAHPASMADMFGGVQNVIRSRGKHAGMPWVLFYTYCPEWHKTTRKEKRMKRKFLEDMGLTKEQVDSIMSENEKDVNAAKADLDQTKTELEQTKTQLQEANTTIDGFKDYDQVKSQVEEYKTKYEETKTEYEAKISDMQFGTTLEAAITAAGGRNAKAIKALLDVDTLKASKNQTVDIKAAIEACQKENEYLFGAIEPINNPVGPTGKTGFGQGDSNTAALRAAMGLPAEESK